jgi:hypothetical protein
MDGQDVSVRVECYAGYRGEETPRRFSFGERQVEVDEVVDRWLTPDHRYFKVRGDDGGVYVLRHDAVSGRWEMT